MNWDIIRKIERQFDDRELNRDSVVVTVPTFSGVESDDLFESPQSISSGVYTIPGVFEYDIWDRERFVEAGSVRETSGYFLTDKKWAATFQQDRAIVQFENAKYLTRRIDYSTVADSILITLQRK